MGFESGSVSFVCYELPEGGSPDMLERFAREAAPPLESLSREPICGWVSGRHLLDRDLREENCFVAGYLFLHFLKAERKIPEALLRAHCRMEEEVERRARGVPFLSRKVRADIRQQVIDQLLPTMPPTLTGIPMVVDFNRRRLYAGAVSEKARDVLLQAVQHATGMQPKPISPDPAAWTLRRIRLGDLPAVLYTGNPRAEPGEIILGDDFLTWLWYHWEHTGGIFRLAPGDPEPFGFMLEGPLLFFHAADGAHEAVLRKGSPLNSLEAGAALWCGKKLRRARLTLARGEQTWSGTLDAELFSFRSVTLPRGEVLDSSGRFQDRMLALDTFFTAVLALFERFLDLRLDPAAWERERAGIRAWVAQRSGQPAP